MRPFTAGVALPPLCGGSAAQELQRPIGVHIRAQFAADHGEYRAVGIDDEGVSFDGHEFAQQSPFDPVALGHGAVGIRQQRVFQPLRAREPGLDVHGIGADPRAAGAECGELGGQIAEVARLGGAHRRVGGGVEEEYEWPAGHQGIEGTEGAGLVR